MNEKTTQLRCNLLFCLTVSILLYCFPVLAFGEACISLLKSGPETALPGENITYTFTVTNCGDVNFNSGTAWVIDPMLDTNPIWKAPLDAGNEVTFSRDYLIPERFCGELNNTATAYGSVNLDLTTYDAISESISTVTVPCCGDGILDEGEGCDDGNNISGDGCSMDCTEEALCGDGIIDVGETCDDGNNEDGDGCSSTCQIEPFCGDGNLDPGEQCDDGNQENGDGCSMTCGEEIGGEGCTPGYWKQSHHFDSWPSPLTPDTPFSAVFEDSFPGMSLHYVLAQGGGGLNALGRHTVAALLNAASPGVSYDRSSDQVIEMFNGIYPGEKNGYEGVKNVFNYFNELGCPLN